MRVLYVEDEPLTRLAMERVLTEHGHTMIWASTAIAAIDLLRTEIVDLVLLDFELDGVLNGSYVAKHVARRIPVFMISGYAIEEMKEKISNTLDGVTLFFAKPVDADELIHAIETVERTRRAT